MLHLISTAEHSRVAWLPQFVGHYRGLGVDCFHLSVHVEPGTPRQEAAGAVLAASQLLEPMGIVLAAVLTCPFDADALRAHHDHLQAQVAEPGDWIVWADLDEFQVYPAPLRDLIRQAEKGEHEIFKGVMIDRVAADGALVDFDPRRPVWEQYPMRARITRDVALGCDVKLTCGRAEVAVEAGNHGPCSGTHRSVSPVAAEVHHFKWDSSVVPRLRRRLEPDWKERCWWWTESARILEHIERNGGRIDAAVLERDGRAA